MGTWIRSQNRKTLVNANEVYARIKNKNEFEICTGKGNSLGIYSSEKKAIKVLDMIQQAITGKMTKHYDYPYTTRIDKGVFIMPKDDEVNMEE
jgi:hypothetical protein